MLSVHLAVVVLCCIWYVVPKYPLFFYALLPTLDASLFPSLSLVIYFFHSHLLSLLLYLHIDIFSQPLMNSVHMS